MKKQWVKHKIGRPTIPKEQRRDCILNIRVTAAEHKKIVAYCKRKKLNLSNWIRYVLIDK